MDPTGSSSTSKPRPRLGRVGDYVLLEPLGRGAMGQVYRARLEGSDRLVALKLASGVLDGPRLERFRREGQITAALKHPHIVPVHTAGVVEGRPYLVYPLVEGARTLREVMPTWPLRRQVEALRDVARALGHAHTRGVVHRDVKPENVLVTPEDTVLLADFGVANTESLERMTRTQAMVGSPLYLAPELATQGAQASSPAVDVYSLGVMLYETLAGEHPYAARGFSAVADPSLRVFPPPERHRPEVPRALSRACLGALERNPARRFPNGDALAEALDAWLEGAEAPPRRLAWLGAALLLVAAAAGGGFLVLRSAPAPLLATPAPPATTAPTAPSPAAPPPTPAPPRRTAGQETALTEALQRVSPGHPNDPDLLAALRELRGALGPHEPAAGRLADGVLSLLRDAETNWASWGLPALEALQASGARPQARFAAEAVCDALYWGAKWQADSFDEDGLERGATLLVELDVDIDLPSNYFDQERPLDPKDPPALRYVRARAALPKWWNDLEHLTPLRQLMLELGRNPGLGPTTRARALSLGLDAIPDPGERLALATEALQLDPQSPKLQLEHAHALLFADQVQRGLAELQQSWQALRAGYRSRQAVALAEAEWLTHSLRMLLLRDQVDVARALLADYDRAYADLGTLPPERVRLDHALHRYETDGPDDPRIAGWLSTGVIPPKF